MDESSLNQLSHENKELHDAVSRLTAENARYRLLLEEIKTCLVLYDRNIDGFEAVGAVKKVTKDLGVLRGYFDSFKSQLVSIKSQCDANAPDQVRTFVDSILGRI